MNINGKQRDLSVPCEIFQEFSEQYLIPLIRQSSPHEACHGAERAWSPKKSLEAHLPVQSALSLDMKSAFPNLPYQAVESFYYALTGSREAAEFLARISTVMYEGKRGLPQGAGFSNPLFNRTLKAMDEFLAKKAKQRGMKYSRWVDDITITSPEKLGEQDLLGAVELVGRFMPVSPTKVFYQTGTIYLLGHKIIDGEYVLKNSDSEREANKAKPIKFSEWFGNQRKYKPWL